MSEARREETLREIFKAALASNIGTFDPKQHHPVDDDELLLEWSVGELDAARHRAVLDHLAQCSYCRRELADMIQAGALVLPEMSQAEEEIADESRDEETPRPTAPLRSPRSRAPSKRGLLVAAAAIAASLIIAVIWGTSDRGGDAALALARRDLDAGRPQAAMDRVEQYLNTKAALDAHARAEADRVLEESGYRLASEQLGAGTTESRRQVLDIEARVARRAAASGRIVNLRLQAQRGMTDECSLRTNGTLSDYGYDSTGQNFSKGGLDFSTTTDTTKRLEKEFAEAIAKHPDAVDLRLNFGHFLMEQRDFPAAAEQFAAAVKTDPNSMLAETGLGLALFQQETRESIEQALAHFRKAVELAPSDRAANRNLAVCLARLGKNEEAKRYFEKAGDDAGAGRPK